MYSAILLGLVAIGVLLVAHGARRHRGGIMGAGIAVLVATAALFSTLDTWAEYLWFQSEGYSSRFWELITAQAGTALVFAVAGFIVVYLLTLPVRRSLTTRYWPEIAGAFLGASWGYGNWQEAMLFLKGGAAGIADPILGRDAGFYLFRLPFYDSLLGLAVLWVLVSLAAGIIALVSHTGVEQARYWFNRRISRYTVHEMSVPPEFRLDYLFVPVGAVLLLIAWWHYLGIFQLLYSPFGVVFGPGWADVHVRLPGHIITGILALLLGLSLLLPPVQSLSRRVFHALFYPFGAVVGPLVTVAAVWVLAVWLVPGIVQWLVVTPNEVTLERSYIANNIKFTRTAFGLDRVDERQFPVAGSLTSATVAANKDLLGNVRLWDWRALAAVYKQFQAIRLYYEFRDIDIDRYSYGGQYRQVMLSARELSQGNLPAQSQTFVNQRFKYTHGYGVVMSDVTVFTPDGLPNLLLKDIPPVAAYPELRVDRPEIYFGEDTNSYVIANSATAEFDYPKGEENAYVKYAGHGGVRLDNVWRKFLFGWKFDGTQFFFSSYPRPESRVMFHRNVLDCVQTLAPFLQLDPDPYVVLADGRLYWIVDGYTTSRHFPYSARYSGDTGVARAAGETGQALDDGRPRGFEGANYIRNSVKAVVDAYNGTVSFYVFEPNDPLIQAWQRIFPGVFRPKSEMPAALRAHVRYPHQFLLAQGVMYSKYHMTDPVVFYNQEDLWVRATQKSGAHVQQIEPYYVMWKVPDRPDMEFSVILPFTPKNRQNLIGWIAGLCDGDDYGRLISYRFSKEEKVTGPQQVESKIDQDAYLSGQLTLWDQGGSQVIRGDVISIPLNDTLLYVEPIYLQAQSAAYPELRLVALMQGETLAYAQTFDEALQRLLQAAAGQAPPPAGSLAQGQPAGAGAARQAQVEGQPAPPATTGAQPGAVNPALAREARDAFEAYLRLQGQGKFTEAAQQLERLRTTLERLNAPPAKSK